MPDFRLLIGTQPFDPAEVAPAAPNRAGATQAILVQFRAPLTAPDADRLQAAYGLALDRAVPNLAYLERLAPEALERVRADFLVRAVIPLTPAMKLAPSIADAPAPLELEATLFDDVDVAAALAAAGAREVQASDERRVRFVLDDPAAAAAIAALDAVVWIEPVFPIEFANQEAVRTNQSGAVARAPIWDRGLHGEGQVIGVIDDGPIAIDHCFFADAAPNQPGAAHRKVLAVHNETGTSAAGRHATIVAGIAAGDDRGTPGAHRHRGGAWAAKLVITNSADMTKPKARSLRHVLDRARKSGAFIHTNSWGLSRSSLYDRFAQDADAFAYVNEHHLVVAAGANTGGTNTPPGTSKNTLCVSAAREFPHEMGRGSGRDGPTQPDKRRKPDLMAVGCGIESVTMNTMCGTSALPGCATSWATPHAAAAAALVRQYFTEGWYPEGKKQAKFATTPTGALLRAVLLNSTVDMTGEPGYPSDAEGWGLIRLDRVLFFEGGPRRLIVKDAPRAVGLEAHERRVHKFFVNGTDQQLKLTLVWTDPPATEHAFMHPPRNHVELKVTDPDEREYIGNVFTEDDFADLVNNVQMVIVDSPPRGTWTVQLRTEWVQADGKPPRLPFALVASGGLDVTWQFYD